MVAIGKQQTVLDMNRTSKIKSLGYLTIVLSVDSQINWRRMDTEVYRDVISLAKTTTIISSGKNDVPARVCA
jgi:hypothetical protein